LVDDVAVHAAKRAQEIAVLLRADLEERRALFHLSKGGLYFMDG